MINREVTFNFSESRSCLNIYRMFPVNTPLDNREVTLIHLKRAQTLRWEKCLHANGSMNRRYSMLTVLPLNLCLVPSAIHLRSKLQGTGLQVLQSTERCRRIFSKIFCVSDVHKSYGENMSLNQRIIKNSNLIKAMKNSVGPKAKVIRRPNFSESRICPNIYRMFRCGFVPKWTEQMSTYDTFSFETSANFALKCATGSIHANGSMTINVIPC